METNEESPVDVEQALLDQAMKLPGVSVIMDAYVQIEAAYLGATAATVTAPLVVTTNSAR